MQDLAWTLDSLPQQRSVWPCMDTLIHSQFGQVDLSRSKCSPCTEQDYGPLRAARSCPAGVRTSSRHGCSQRKGWEKPALSGHGEERFPQRPSCLFCQILQNSFLGFAEESCDSRNHQRDPRKQIIPVQIPFWLEGMCPGDTTVCPVFAHVTGMQNP